MRVIQYMVRSTFKGTLSRDFHSSGFFSCGAGALLHFCPLWLHEPYMYRTYNLPLYATVANLHQYSFKGTVPQNSGRDEPMEQ
jgi:hypothetical protein